MIDARNYLVGETLRNGLSVCIRAVRPEDGDLLVEAFHKLDPESIYLRFFGPKKEISAVELKNLREADFDTRVILVCTIEEGGREIVIASGTYVRCGEAVAPRQIIRGEEMRLSSRSAAGEKRTRCTEVVAPESPGQARNR